MIMNWHLLAYDQHAIVHKIFEQASDFELVSVFQYFNEKNVFKNFAKRGQEKIKIRELVQKNREVVKFGKKNSDSENNKI